MNRKTITLFILALAIVAAVGTLYLLSAIPDTPSHGEYNLVVTKNGLVTVFRTDNNTQCGPFNIRSNVAPGRYTIGSEDDTKGIYTVTGRDTTSRPGSFTLVIGEASLDIRDSRVFFDDREIWWHEMTYGIMHFYSKGPPNLVTLVFWTSLGFALLTSIISIIFAAKRLSKGKSVFVISSINKLVALITGLCCASSFAWDSYINLSNLVLYTASVHTERFFGNLLIGFSQTMKLVTISIIICGVNSVIGMILGMKWKEPQQSVPGYPPQSVGSPEP